MYNDKVQEISMCEVGLLQFTAYIISTIPFPPEMGTRFLFGRTATGPHRMVGPAPHKSGGFQVKSRSNLVLTAVGLPPPQDAGGGVYRQHEMMNIR